MPMYEYQCQECGEIHEALQKISDDPLINCPACGQAALKKIISQVSFRLKGQGWYETDFKTSNQRNVVGGQSESNGQSNAADSKGANEVAVSESASKESSTSSNEAKKDSSVKASGTAADTSSVKAGSNDSAIKAP